MDTKWIEYIYKYRKVHFNFSKKSDSGTKAMKNLYILRSF